jgi:hypothetical protein
VAARVGSRSANECFAKIFDAARSPAAGAKLPRAKTVVSECAVMLSASSACLHVFADGACCLGYVGVGLGV